MILAFGPNSTYAYDPVGDRIIVNPDWFARRLAIPSFGARIGTNRLLFNELDSKAGWMTYGMAAGTDWAPLAATASA